MTLRSVLDIDVNSGEFAKFAAMYAKYQEAQTKTAAIAKQAGKEQVNTRNTFAQQVELMKLEARLAQEGNASNEKQQKTLTQSDRLWTSISKSTKSVAGSIIDATRSLLSWTGILTGIGGLLGAGGLFGLDRMAHSVAGQRQTATGLGMSIGELKSFQTNFNRVVDPDAFLSWISQMQSDPEKGATANALGFQITGNTESDALAAMRALRGKSKEWDPRLYGTMLNAFGVGGVNVQNMRQMRGTGSDEWNQMFAGNQRDISRLNIDDGTAKKWQDFTTKLQEAGSTIFKVFVDGLTPLIGPLSHLSDAFVNFLQVILRKDGIAEQGINTVAGWLDSFAGKISKPEFLKAVEQFTSDIGWLAHAVHVVAHPLDAAEDTRDRMSGGSGAWGWLARRNESALTGVSDLVHGRWGKLWGDAVGTSIWGDMSAASKHQGLLSLVKKLENSGADAVSPKGAQGMYQLMPGTQHDYGVTNPFDPQQSREGASRFLAHLEKKYHWDAAKVLGAYNWGEGNMDSYLATGRGVKGQSMPAETRNYLAGAGLTININNATGGSAIASAAALGPP